MSLPEAGPMFCRLIASIAKNRLFPHVKKQHCINGNLLLSKSPEVLSQTQATRNIAVSSLLPIRWSPSTQPERKGNSQHKLNKTITELSQTTHCYGHFGFALSCNKKLLYGTFITDILTLIFCISGQYYFYVNYKMPSSHREVFVLRTCHPGHCCPINENSATGFLPVQDYGKRQKPSLLYLGCSSL